MGGTELATAQSLGRYSHSISDSSKEHEREPGHTTSAGHFTAPDTGTLCYSCFIRG